MALTLEVVHFIAVMCESLLVGTHVSPPHLYVAQLFVTRRIRRSCPRHLLHSEVSEVIIYMYFVSLTPVVVELLIECRCHVKPCLAHP
jgi:hypothetical protein